MASACRLPSPIKVVQQQRFSRAVEVNKNGQMPLRPVNRRAETMRERKVFCVSGVAANALEALQRPEESVLGTTAPLTLSVRPAQ